MNVYSILVLVKSNRHENFTYVKTNPIFIAAKSVADAVKLIETVHDIGDVEILGVREVKFHLELSAVGKY